VGQQQGPPSLVSTTEELLGSSSSGSGLEMWASPRVTTLQAFVACYRDSSTFISFLLGRKYIYIYMLLLLLLNCLTI
jgi:hypothetical protein